MEGLTPKQIVQELNKYIIGQDKAKKSVAIAIRNRMRRLQLTDELRNEVSPKNIIMIGPTGIGKTEIARRLAKLANAPFLKVEASKYTEVGYVGRDVESMVRDITDISVNMVKQEKALEVRRKAEENTEERLLDLLLPTPRKGSFIQSSKVSEAKTIEEKGDATETWLKTREKFREKLHSGKFDERIVEVETRSQTTHMVEILSPSGIEEFGMDIKSLFERVLPPKSKTIKMPISEAREVIIQEETEKLVDKDKIIKEAVQRVEETGIIFIDEIDKVAGRGYTHGPDVSREGVQRDLLPIIEGSTVLTKYGMVKTDHILFIAAGAFHMTKPSDLIPELQGRFPIRVELDSLNAKDFKRILVEPQNSLTKQYQALLKTENVDITFTEDGIEEIANYAFEVNRTSENIGARRLHTIMERLLEDISFESPEKDGEKVIINKEYVKEKLFDIVKDEDLSKFIL